MILAPLLLQAVFGVSDPAVPFSPVPVPTSAADPCVDKGPGGTWVKMSSAGAAKSIHNEGWLDSAATWNGTRLVVAVRRNGTWRGTTFDPCANAWSPMAETTTLPPAEPWRSGTDRPFRAGRDARYSSFDSFEQVSAWSPARKAWIAIKARSTLAARLNYAMVWTGKQVLIWGGWSAPPVPRTLGDGAILDLARKTWKPMSNAHAPSPRFRPVVAWTGKRLLIWGGQTTTFSGNAPNPPTALDDGASYDPASDRWTPMSTVDAPSARTDAVVAWSGRKLVVYGGVKTNGDPGQLSDGGIYDPATNQWMKLGPAPDHVVLPRLNVGPLTRILVAPDGRVLFLPEGLPEIVVLDPNRAEWSTIPTGELGKRNSFRAFLLGRRLIVWGGQILVAEHRCPPPIPGQPICDSWAENAPRDDGAMLLLPPR